MKKPDGIGNTDDSRRMDGARNTGGGKEVDGRGAGGREAGGGRGTNVKKFTHMKHGLYARYFDNLEASELAEIGEGIDAELKALRIAAGRLFERASEKDRDWESEMRLLEAFGRQCLAVAALVRTKKVVEDMTGEVGESIKQALLVAGEEWSTFKERR